MLRFNVADSRDDTRPRTHAIGTDCASASGQSAKSVRTSESTSSRCHGTSPVSRRCIGAARSAAHPLQNEHAKPASTFNMGRRIVGARTTTASARVRRQHGSHARTNANNQIDAHSDEPLRAFVRALARQAARELFEAQRTRHSAEMRLRHGSMKVAIYARYSSDDQHVAIHCGIRPPKGHRTRTGPGASRDLRLDLRSLQ